MTSASVPNPATEITVRALMRLLASFLGRSSSTSLGELPQVVAAILPPELAAKVKIALEDATTIDAKTWANLPTTEEERRAKNHRPPDLTEVASMVTLILPAKQARAVALAVAEQCDHMTNTAGCDNLDFEAKHKDDVVRTDKRILKALAQICPEMAACCASSKWSPTDELIDEWTFSLESCGLSAAGDPDPGSELAGMLRKMSAEDDWSADSQRDVLQVLARSWAFFQEEVRQAAAEAKRLKARVKALNRVARFARVEAHTWLIAITYLESLQRKPDQMVVAFAWNYLTLAKVRSVMTVLAQYLADESMHTP